MIGLENEISIDNFNYKQIFEKELKGSYKRIIYLKDEIIVKEGLIDDYIYFLDSGKVVITKNDLKKDEYSIGYIMQGEFFGFSSFFEMPEIATYRALTSCIIYAIDTIYLRKRLENYSELRKIAELIAMNSFRNLSKRQSILLMRESKFILLNFIYEQMMKYGKEEDNGELIIDLDLNIGDISKILNIARETISRILSNLKNQGIVDTKRKQIIIRDVDKFLKEINA